MQFFPNLIGLEFVFCSIENLVGDELEEYKNLEHLKISHSNLTRIPKDFFQFAPNLKSLDFYKNKLQHIGENLDNLKHLKVASFNENICINKRAENRFEIPGLIKALKENCIDIEVLQTTTEEPNSKERPIEKLSRKVNILKAENLNLEDELKAFKKRVEDFENFFSSLPSYLKPKTNYYGK